MARKIFIYNNDRMLPFKINYTREKKRTDLITFLNTMK